MTDVARVNIEFPDDLHRQAKASAALAGTSLKDFILQAVEAAVKKAKGGK